MPNDRPVIMIVDDQPLNLQYLAEVLDDEYRVKVAPGGREALQLVRRPPYPEVILLDVMMPEMDGYEVCETLKKDPLTAAIPVIFVTACTDAESETAALRSGAVDFIHKPLNPEVVRARVRVHQELARHRHHLEELVHERTLELAQARDGAESANRVKTALLANISHEMRTPLNHITGMAYLIRRNLPKEGKECDQMAVIEKAARLLLGLVTDLLDLARLEAGELELEYLPFEPRDLLKQVIDERQASAAEKGLVLTHALDSALPETLVGDFKYLRQILVHLLDNAVKYSEQGEIWLRIGAGESHGNRVKVHFEVGDQGVGMEPELAERLFQLFQLGDDSLTRDQQGLGIGLAYSHRLVALMGGEIRVSSTLGQGTVVGFDVPMRSNLQPAAPDARP